MGWFEFSRSEKYPTSYPEQHTGASIDVLAVALIILFVILAISLFTLLPSLSGPKRWIYIGRVICSLFIGGVVVLGNYGQEWEVGKVSIVTPYKGGTDAEIKGDLGLHISLRGINITLKGDPKDPHARKEYEHETIDYNEHFSWAWDQGRLGFGYYAGRIAREYRAAVYRGVPIPILQVAEYFTFDGEGIRFGRHYKQAGYYSHIMMWCAFPCWLISNILFFVLVRYAAMFLTATGIFQIIAVSIWAYSRNFIELQVPFETKDGNADGEVVLKTYFGPDFYLVFVNGIFCILLGLLILFFDACAPDEVCKFFGIDPLTTYEEHHLTRAELAKERKNNPSDSRRMLDVMEQGHSSSDPGGGNGPEADETNIVWRRRTGHSKLLQKSFKLRKRPAPPPKPSHATITERSEMTVRTPLLQVPRPREVSSEEDEFNDYANLPSPPPPLQPSEYQAPVTTRKREYR